MLGCKEPELLQFSSYIDNTGWHNRAPRWTISWNENNVIGKEMPTAARDLQPGQYKIDRDFVSDITTEVKKGRLTGSASAPQFTFGSENRCDPPSGALKGVIRPNNRWMSPGSPGLYNAIDSMDRHKRTSLQSSYAWSVGKGEPQETIRERQLQGRTPGPGIYELPSFFDEVDRQRQEAGQKLHARKAKASHMQDMEGEGTARPGGQWKNQWGNMFRSIHASATSGKRPAAK